MVDKAQNDKPTKREIKRAKQRERKAKLDHERAKMAELQAKARAMVQSAKKDIKKDAVYRKHALAFEMLVEMVDLATTEINNVVDRYGVRNSTFGEYAESIKLVSGDKVAEQAKDFIVKTDLSYDEFNSRQDFIYEMILLLADVKPEDRIKAESSIKLLIK